MPLELDGCSPVNSTITYYVRDNHHEPATLTRVDPSQKCQEMRLSLEAAAADGKKNMGSMKPEERPLLSPCM